MNRIRYQIFPFVLSGVLVFCSLAIAEEDSTIFHCLTPDTVQEPAAALAGERTLNPVAIYACSDYAATTRLPKWYDSGWPSGMRPNG